MNASVTGSVIALLPEGIEIPAGISDLESFRAWVRSRFFPESGRIDWVAGRLEVDMSPEDLNTHGTLKSAISAQLVNSVQETDRGVVFIDRTRLSSPAADLSAEPDVLVLLMETVEAGHARLIPKASGEEGRYIEIEGTADIVVECISDASIQKDCQRLRERYHRARVREYWLVDARGETVDFQVLLFRPAEYEAAIPDAEGFRHSEVLGGRVRLVRRRRQAGLVVYRLEVR